MYCSSAQEKADLKNNTAKKNPIKLDCDTFGFLNASEIPEISKSTNNLVAINIEGESIFLDFDLVTNAKNIDNHQSYSQFIKFYSKECKNLNHPNLNSIQYLTSLKANSIPFKIIEQNLIGKGHYAEQDSSLKDFVDAHFNRYDYKTITNSTLNLTNENEFYHDSKKGLYNLIINAKTIVLETELFKLGTYDFKKQQFPILYNCSDNPNNDFRCEGLGYTDGNGLKAKDRVRLNELNINVPKEFASDLISKKLIITGKLKTSMSGNGIKTLTILPIRAILLSSKGEFKSN
jgi:hypothetical protein